MTPLTVFTACFRRYLAPLLALLLAGSAFSAAAQQGGPPSVSVAKPVQREVVDWDEFTGRFAAVQRVAIRAQVSGYIDSVDFVDGQLVEKGALLYVIDARPYQADVDRARAAVAGAESRLALADLELARAERLLSSSAIAREEVDSRRATRKGALADVEGARADLRAAELDLEFTRVTSPIAGRVSNSQVDVGNLVEGGAGVATTLTTVVSLNPIHFEFDVSESEYLHYSRNGAQRPTPDTPPEERMRSFVRLLDESEWAREGYIDFVDNAFNQGTGTIRVRASFDNPDRLLLPGIFGRLRVAASKPYRALLVPDAAVVSDQSNKLLMVVGEDDVVQPRPVVLGPLHEGLRVVREGIGPEDRVIVQGLLRARPGNPVAPQETTIGAGE